MKKQNLIFYYRKCPPRILFVPLLFYNGDAMNDMYRYLSSYLSEEEIEGLRSEMESGRPPHKGFVANLGRVKKEDLFAAFPSLKEDEGDPVLFRYDPLKDSPGRTVFHEGGAFYILDPSAAEATHVFKTIDEPHLVLDLCAAPGGKTISYALRNPKSLIVANDISKPRAETLSKNVERMGLANTVVTSLDPHVFAERFSASFDRIILDAPCSGTGMFRKEEKMKDDWSVEKTEALLPIQKDLLNLAYSLLKEGGELLYITCSFLKEEDEDQVASFLKEHPDMKTVRPEPFKDSYREGKLKDSVHLFPNLFEGEGHFFALLRKDGERAETVFPKGKDPFDEKLGLYKIPYNGDTYALPYDMRDLMNLRPLRLGLKCTDSYEYAKIQEDHALSHYLKGDIELTLEQAEAYFRGEELNLGAALKDGTHVVSYRGVSLGFVLKKGRRVRNVLPKGLRKNLIG
jgi:16S rRNA C967 or C1407 C5-methylase (RsmB/RsmF family)/NOL1/NOP2/fmu family ribosome biogenesis protein